MVYTGFVFNLLNKFFTNNEKNIFFKIMFFMSYSQSEFTAYHFIYLPMAWRSRFFDKNNLFLCTNPSFFLRIFSHSIETLLTID